MGIKDLLKLKVNNKELREHYKRITFNDLENKIVGVDAMLILFTALTNGPILKDKNNHVTLHINTIINKMIKMNCKQIWVFDNPKKSIFKTDTIKKRMKTSYKTAVFQEIKLSEAIDDLKKILTLSKTPFVTSPRLVEAEVYLCEMKRYNIIDYILTKDTDVLAYGFDMLYFESAKLGFRLYENKSIRNLLNLTMDEFRKLCIMLGTDFNDKTKGISSQNMIKNLHMPYTPAQTRTNILFQQHVLLKYKDNLDVFLNIKKPVLKNNEKLNEFLKQHDFIKLIERLNN